MILLCKHDIIDGYINHSELSLNKLSCKPHAYYNRKEQTMVVENKTILSVSKDLLIDLALSKDTNRYGEDVYLLYNPVGYGGVLTVGDDVVGLINQFDGTKTVEQAIAAMNFDANTSKTATLVVDELVKNQILVADEITPRKDAWKKELNCWLHITNDCNLNCTYCYIHKSHSVMEDSLIYKSIDMMIESCLKHDYTDLTLMLVGGEPLTRFNTIKLIVAYCERHKQWLNIKFVIPTNGTLITPDVAKFIAEKHISVGVSLDGPSEYHDINRIKIDNSGSFAAAMDGIDRLISAGVKPSIMTTVTAQNLDGLPEFTKLMIDKQLYFRYSFERDTQTGNPGILQNQEHCIEVMNECFDIMKDALNNGKTGWRFKFGDVGFNRPKRRACAAGKNFFSIGQDGSIGSCSLGLECTRASIYELNDIIPDIENIFADISKTSACDIPECKDCVWRHSCAGACPLQTFATYKTFLHVSPHCALYKALLPEVIRIEAMTIYYNNKQKEV